MPDPDDALEVGYGKPPKHTQFTKGKSGNPKGRPKGSQNFVTVLDKAARQRVRVTENGRTRFATKLEATFLQLTNKSASGDLKAINELRYWFNFVEKSRQAQDLDDRENPLQALVEAMNKRSKEIGPPEGWVEPEGSQSDED